MNDREKLIEWIADVLDFVDWDSIEATADYLIENGVVIQEQCEWVDGMKCSNCKQIDWSKPPFCPNCGAKVKEVKHG